MIAMHENDRLFFESIAGTFSTALGKKRTDEEMIELRRAKDTLTDLVVHDIKNISSTMYSWVDIISEEVLGDLNEDQSDAVKRIAKQSEELFNLSEEMLDIARAEEGDIKIIREEAVVWNDGALGCPKPGEFYIQMMINGYWVILEVEGLYYDYRVTNSGDFKICEEESLPPVTSPDMSDQSQNPLVIQAMEDLAARLGIQTSAIELLEYKEVVWPDSSLGCPQPGMKYLQVPMDGALIRLRAEKQEYEYHSGGNRGVFLCEQTFKINTCSRRFCAWSGYSV